MPAAVAIPAAAAVAGAAISSNASSKASKAAARSAGDQLEFEKAQYEDWQNIFGPIQDNLSNYYQSLTPDYYEAAGLEAFQKERDSQMAQLQESLAQRGLSTSGVSAAIERTNAIDTAQTRASIRREAPAKAAEEQSRFLQIGMGSNPANSYSTALGQVAQQQQQYAYQSQVASGQAMGNAVSTVGNALSNYLGSSNSGSGTTQNISPIGTRGY